MSENTTNINNKLTVGRATVEPATMSNGNVLFSLQPYIEKEYIPDHSFLIANEDPTIETIDDANAPYSKVLRFIGNNSDCYLGEKIPVSAGERIYLELWYMIPADDAGTAGVNYLGVKRYDKDQKEVAGNGGRYYVASGVTFVKDGDWHKMSGYYTVESSHTPYNGSDGGAIRYLDITLILNYTSGTQEINISGLTIKKVNTSYDEGDTAFKGDVGIGTDDPSAKLQVVGTTNDGSTDLFKFENSDNTDYLTMNNAGRVELSTGNDIPLLITRPNGNGVLHFRNDANEGSITYFGNGEARYGTGVIQNGTEFEYHVGWGAPQEGGAANPSDLPSMTSRMVVKENGQIKFNAYTSGNFVATPAEYLGVDGSGNIVKTSSITVDTPNLSEVMTEGSTASSLTSAVNITTTEGLTLASSGASKNVFLSANSTSGLVQISSFNLQLVSTGTTTISGKTAMPYWAGDGQRPTVGTNADYGVFGFNLTRNTIEVYNGTAWVQMS